MPLSNLCDIELPLFLVGAIGRLSPEKGFDVLIQAFRDWQEEGFRSPPSSRGCGDAPGAPLLQPVAMNSANSPVKPDLVESADAADAMKNVNSRHRSALGPYLIIAGGGPEAERLAGLAQGTAGVTLAGELEDVTPLVHAADVIVVPSRKEGQGIVALEAMAARKPVVASHVGGLPELILNGETGLLVPPNDPAALNEALRALAASPALRSQMGKRGRERVDRHFTLDAMVERLSAIYRESVQSSR